MTLKELQDGYRAGSKMYAEQGDTTRSGALWGVADALEPFITREAKLEAALQTIAAQGEGESPTSRAACMAAIARQALSAESPPRTE